ncbi:MAG: VWA domain-containing protein [Deltaproteobacteria bacterium]|nr:VWA domain-containing protein [Deltaproteobacteria bacterium]
MSITLDDIRHILLNRGDVSILHKILKKTFKSPPLAEINTSPTALLKRSNPQLAEAVEGWMSGRIPPKRSKPKIKIHIRPVIPYGRNVSEFIESSITQLKPDVVALDTPPVTGLGSGNFYAFSFHNMLGLPMSVKTLSSEGALLNKGNFFSGSLLETTIIKCYLEHIPLVPIGVPARKAPSRTEHIFHQFLEKIYEDFDQSLGKRHTDQDIQEQAFKLITHIWNASPAVKEEREYLIDECCYLASRITELRTLVKKGSCILIFIDMKHLSDIEPLLKTLNKGNHLWEEFYQPPLRIGIHSHYQASEEKIDHLWEYAKAKGPSSTLIQKLFQKNFKKWATKITQETLTPSSADQLITHILDITRNHPEIERGASVRGSLALREVAQGYACLGTGYNRSALYQASLTTLPHRIQMKPGSEREPLNIIKEISKEALYELSYHPEEKRTKKSKPSPLTRDNLKQALEGLTDAVLKHDIAEQKSFSSQDWSLAKEMMNHPLVQEALSNANYPTESQEALSKLLEELEEREFLQHSTPDSYALTEKGKKDLIERFKQRLERGEINPDQLKEILNQIKGLPTSSSGISMKLPKEKMSQFLAELMDAQHQGRSSKTSLEDIYVHYTLGEKKGVKTDPEKLDYQKLQIMIHQLEEKGLLKVSGSQMKHYTLTSRALSRLLEELIPKSSSSSLTKHAFKKEHEIEKAEVRRYKKGDVYRDISIRHTLKEMIKHGKTLKDIGQKEFRSFEKKPIAQLDIVLCVDVSASMKEQSKLRYAKLALAGLAKAALDKQDRVGIVAFSNVGNVIAPLTDDYRAIMNSVIRLRADQYTNIGNGLLRARNMLLRDKGGNKKHIILISDGQPNAALSADAERENLSEQEVEFSKGHSTPGGWIKQDQLVKTSKGDDWKTKEQLGTKHAIIEARKTKDNDIKISVLLITHQDELGEWIARKIAQIGRGKFYRVKTIENMPIDALQMFQ